MSPTVKERNRKDRVRERGESARRMIRCALSWEGDEKATFVLASLLVEGRNCKQLAALYSELPYLDAKTAYGARARRIVQLASEAIARELV